MDNTKCDIINAKAYEAIDAEIERLEIMGEKILNATTRKDEDASLIIDTRIQALLWAKRIFYPKW